MEQISLYHSEYTVSFIAFSVLILGFLGYHLLSSYLKNIIGKSNGISYHISYASFISQRITGFLFFGIIPVIVFRLLVNIRFADYGINLENIIQSFIWIGVFAPIVLVMSYFVSRTESNLRNYPQIRLKQWNSKYLTISFLTWLIYLFAYEALFRGLLLFSFYHTFGVSIAIAVNVILYAMVHIPKGRKETVGAIPFGIILCLITLSTGSFFAAFMIHGIMAVSNEFFSIRAHPEMSMKSKWI